MNLKVFKSICMAIAGVLMITVASCSNEDYLGLENFDNSQTFTRSASIDYSEYLTISTTEFGEWTEKDFESIDKAIERFNIVYSDTENRYKYDVTSGEDINISDSLYLCVTKMIDHTNAIFEKTDGGKIVRMKTRSTESSSSTTTELPDCVPAAISNMGRNAPAYSEVIKKCDELFPSWRTQGGVPIDEVKNLIEYYVPVTEYDNLDPFPEGSAYSLPNYVMIFNNHAVNAYKMSKLWGGLITIYYEDHSSTTTGGGFILGREMRRIYVFD